MSKDEFSLTGYTACLNLTEQGHVSDKVSAVAGVGPVQLRQIGEDAARAAGLPFDAVSVTVEVDEADKPSYFFTYTIPRVNNATGATRSALAGELRDRLLAMGDTLYPYIRIISD